METIELDRGETIKIRGQKDGVFLVVTNVDGEIYTKTDYRREEE